jgi:transposase-like protein
MTDTWCEVIMPPFTGVFVMAKYRKYSKEFQLQAAKLVTEQGYSYNQAAKKLGVTDWSVRNWIKKFQQNGELPSKSESQPKIDEIRKLKKELIQLRMENDILKKAAAYFAKESL